jgi:hypothetical protein
MVVENMSDVSAKVLFELDSGDWHGHASETLWAVPLPESEWSKFQISNSPFFTKGVSYLDVVNASPLDDGLTFKFESIGERGGRSTYMLIMEAHKNRVDTYWNILERMGCSYESAHIQLKDGRRLLCSVDVPPSSDLHDVYEILERGEKDRVWRFQEGHAQIVGR